MTNLKVKSKFTILEKLTKGDNIIKLLSSWSNNSDIYKHQIGFMAEYLLDNICNVINNSFFLFLILFFSYI